MVQAEENVADVISIHAPVRGATNKQIRISQKMTFQFTLPCGERQSAGSLTLKALDFNSRSRAGSDSHSV